MVRRVRKIVIVSHYFPPHVGGIEIVAQAEAEELSRAGHSVSVITSKVTKRERSGEYFGVYVTRVPALNLFEKYGIPFPIFSPTLLTTTYRKVKHSDIVHVHDTFYLTSLVAGLAARHYKKPLILTQHVDFVSHPYKLVGLIERSVYRVNGAVLFKTSRKSLVINDRIKQFLLSRGVNGENIVRLLNGVDTSMFRPVSMRDKLKLRKALGLNPDDFIVLFIGRFVPKKGYGAMLAARDSSYHMVFAGGDTPKKTYEHASFFGKVPHEQMAQLFQTADVFVLPSKDEGFPLTVQEAMACGLPVITSDDPGYTTYMLDNNLIWLIKNPDFRSIKAAIQKLKADIGQQKRMSRYSRRYAVTHFSWQNHVRELSKLYDEAIEVGSNRS